MYKTSLWLVVLMVGSLPAAARQFGTTSPDTAGNCRADSHFHLLDYRYESPGYAYTGRLETSESFTSSVLASD